MSSVLSLLKAARIVFKHYSRSFCIGFLTILLPATAMSETIYVDDQPVNVQVAKSEAEQQRGLQGVRHLEKNQGMLFVFHPARQVCMWMKDVPIDLDVGFFNDKGQLIAVRHMKAQTENTHCSPRPIAWALEMNAGWFQEKHLAEGAKLRLN